MVTIWPGTAANGLPGLLIADGGYGRKRRPSRALLDNSRNSFLRGVAAIVTLDKAKSCASVILANLPGTPFFVEHHNGQADQPR